MKLVLPFYSLKIIIKSLERICNIFDYIYIYIIYRSIYKPQLKFIQEIGNTTDPVTCMKNIHSFNNSVYCGTSKGDIVVVSLDKVNIEKVVSEKKFLLNTNGIDVKDLPFIYLCGQNGCAIADLEKSESYQWKSANLNQIKISSTNLSEFVTVGDSSIRQLQIWDKRDKNSVFHYSDKYSSGYKSLTINQVYIN